MSPIEFAKKSGFVSSEASPSNLENKMDLSREHLHKQFFLVCDSLGDDVTALNVSHDQEDIWPRLVRFGGKSSMQVFETNEVIPEMVHTRAVIPYNVHTMHTRLFEDLLKRCLKNKVIEGTSK
eukprot:TRINITY_DN16919_c0_g1_i1.p1 TRINITY_DN16919_c0_g1~~TRINITY_DN16919_c0_g1_i1.p1  ORF type:complete len:135 (-),score=30.29 TRINITY_DN16919_c0_g1_i1:11-379(-)